MKFTKKQMMDAFLLFLDDALPSFECEKIKKKEILIVIDAICV